MEITIKYIQQSHSIEKTKTNHSTAPMQKKMYQQGCHPRGAGATMQVKAHIDDTNYQYKIFNSFT